MVAADFARLRQSGVQLEPIVIDQRSLAMHQPARAHDLAAECLDDGLMPEADSEHRDRPGERANHLDRYAGIMRRARPRRNAQMSRRERTRLPDADLVVALHLDLCTEHEKRLHEVVGEGIVVVDQQQPGTRGIHHSPSRAISSARAADPLLMRTSSYSISGLLSATMPAPA